MAGTINVRMFSMMCVFAGLVFSCAYSVVNLAIVTILMRGYEGESSRKW